VLRQAQHDTAPAQHDTAPAQHGTAKSHDDTAQAFLTDSTGENPQYYRAVDESGEVLAAFYADGRVRIAGDRYRFAGIVQNGRADLLEIADNTWSELFVRETPEGRLQLELRGGPYGARVLTCEPFDKLRVTT
jgi:zona occludens toxin (predicted ATPase)